MSSPSSDSSRTSPVYDIPLEMKFDFLEESLRNKISSAFEDKAKELQQCIEKAVTEVIREKLNEFFSKQAMKETPLSKCSADEQHSGLNEKILQQLQEVNENIKKLEAKINEHSAAISALQSRPVNPMLNSPRRSNIRKKNKRQMSASPPCSLVESTLSNSKRARPDSDDCSTLYDPGHASDADSDTDIQSHYCPPSTSQNVTTGSVIEVDDMELPQAEETPTAQAGQPNEEEGFTQVTHRRKKALNVTQYNSSHKVGEDTVVAMRNRKQAGKTPAKSDTENYKKKTAIPPIVIHNLEADFTLFREEIVNLIGAGNFTLSLCKDAKRLKVFCKKESDHKLLVLNLQDKYSFHNHELNSDKKLKYVIRGLTLNYDIMKLKEDLIASGFHPLKIVRLQKKQIPMPLVLVLLENTEDNRDFIKLKNILEHTCTVEKFKGSRVPLQCYRCQRYGHSSYGCHLPPRCNKCAENHDSRTCPQIEEPENFEPKCINCGESHVASSRACAVWRRAADYKRKTASKTTQGLSYAAALKKNTPQPSNANANVQDKALKTASAVAEKLDRMSVKQAEQCTKKINRVKTLLTSKPNYARKAE